MGKRQSTFVWNHKSEKLTPRQIEEVQALKQVMKSICDTFGVERIEKSVFTIKGTFDQDHNLLNLTITL